MTKFTILFRLLWLVEIIMIFNLDRNNLTMLTIVLFLLFILTFITVFRTIESRNEWRKIIKDGDIDIKNHL